jgi:hypothetical protein
MGYLEGHVAGSTYGMILHALTYKYLGHLTLGTRFRVITA